MSHRHFRSAVALSNMQQSLTRDADKINESTVRYKRDTETLLNYLFGESVRRQDEKQMRSSALPF